MFNRISRGFVLRKSANGHFDGFDQMGLSAAAPYRALAATSRFSLFTALFLIALALIALAILYKQPGQLVSSVGDVTTLLAFPAAAATRKKTDTEEKKPANIRKMEADAKAIIVELQQGQTEMAAGPVSQERGEELEEKAKELQELQGNIKRYNNIAGIVRSATALERVTLPGEEESISRKTLFTTPGHLFVMSDEYREVKGRRGSGIFSNPVNVGRRLGKKLRLTGEKALAFEKKAFDAGDLSDLGTDAIISIERDPEIVRHEEPEILSIRDVLNTTTTGSDTIKYVKHTVTERAAATVAKAGLKPFLRIEFDTAQVNVETIAVLSKVTEQDVQDAPRLVSIINDEMTHDVKVQEERQIAWGSGVNELLGLFGATSGISEFNRADVGDTLIDTIRRMRTDLRKVRVRPNFVAIDPIDWEEIELAKGTDERYIWGLIQTLRGPQIWSLTVVESDAMTNPETGERRVLMGDGKRGATIYDRDQIQLAVGFMDDDFGRNLRTLRAEERIAMAIKRPYAFEYTVTAEAES